ncbi:ferritin family protein [Microbacteriaceae bacterium 4G12]
MTFLDKLKKSIDDEYEAAVFYGQLQKQTQNPFFQKLLEEIKNDEKKHFQLFQQLHKQLTGTFYENKKEKKEVPAFDKGIEDALLDELLASEEYREMLFEMPTSQAYYPLFTAMTDEMRHASALAAIYGRLK